MKKLCLLLLLFLSHFLLMPLETTHAKGTQKPVPDTVADPHSKYSAYFQTNSGRYCTAILISSTAALTAKHCVGAKPAKRSGRIYPGLNGNKRPFGYMNISTYTPHPNPKYDIAIIKGTERDQDRFYKYYIKKFTTTVRGYTDDELSGFVGDEVYSYGYPNKKPAPIKVQYRSDGNIYKHRTTPRPYLLTDMPAYDGQSGSGVFKKDGSFIGIIITRTKDNKANTLPFTEDIANWINKNAK
ncbi:trypsin-like serine protease [Staphylococcus pseudintermedius]|uniref:trypsin-like serine peptidase n=1 Tax=Staphylococcus pseudintermedius TaxID=283734 RepID=UPI0011E3DDC2|nr:trypsin-like peptidase domain-containing protein [Staphylococcus pseudintermedius]EGQ1771245.1 serine protease [Staphylococcus pseudintermedius]EGQ2906417.1 trypsin-like serine protease [Staphylococcus pseudintermedius]EGQ3390886.1 trypsin-like serine protease [Staphylococcus pseudintermedius]EHL7199035.1 trypsin-like serine protease [Staphylococcus pseudintermedius]EJG1226377.1 trypsin-like serine protease [Staphylococcus pseudintermedius]